MDPKDDEEAGGREPTTDAQIARLLIRAIWQQDWKVTHPEGTDKECNAEWRRVRKDETTKRGKVFRKALWTLKRAGVTISLPEGYEGDEEA